MSRRTEIITRLIAHVSESTGAVGYRGMRFLHEINSFPPFYIHPSSETRAHIGAGTKYSVLSLAIRGYQWADNLDDVDAFARNLETAIQSFRNENRDLIEEARVTFLKTDEGVMEPYGTVDLVAEIVYTVIN